MIPRYKNKVYLFPDVWLYNYVLFPEYLSLQSLQPNTIHELINYYNEILQNKEYGHIFSNVFEVLKTTRYGGNVLHDQMVRYTTDMDKLKGQCVHTSVPELDNEMCYLNNN